MHKITCVNDPGKTRLKQTSTGLKGKKEKEMPQNGHSWPGDRRRQSLGEKGYYKVIYHRLSSNWGVTKDCARL